MKKKSYPPTTTQLARKSRSAGRIPTSGKKTTAEYITEFDRLNWLKSVEYKK